MLEKLVFENHNGETFTSGDGGGIYANYNDLHDYLWEYSTSSTDKITEFTRGVVKKSLPLIVLCSSAEEGAAKVDQLLEIADKDVVDKSPGRLIVNGYYMRAYIIGSTKKSYLYNGRYMEITLTIVTDTPVWVKEETFYFYGTDEETTGLWLDYPFDFSFDYAANGRKKYIINSSYHASDFELIFWGRALSPSVTINGYKYAVETGLALNEILTINSRDKTVVKTTKTGEQTNLFNYRSKETSIFEKIAAGTLPVICDGDYTFTITLFDERSEPRWSS